MADPVVISSGGGGGVCVCVWGGFAGLSPPPC